MNVNIVDSAEGFMNDSKNRLNRVVEFANERQQRVTYSAAAEYVGKLPRDIGVMLGERCPYNSWIVAKGGDTPGLPTDYKESQLHENLLRTDRIIMSAVVLRRLLGD